MQAAYNSDIQLAGRRVLVTGGARGLGEAFARALLAAGARVVISDVLHDRGVALAAELGSDLHYLPMDLADPAAMSAGVDAAAHWLGGLDGLVNNGAITNSGGKDMADLSVATWDQVMAVNVRGTWLATAAAQPHLAASGSGRVVNIASDTALWGAPRLLAYVASKGAVISMTRSLARELGPSGIGITVVAPGILQTSSTEYVPAERHQLYEQGRAVPGPQSPEDIVGTIVFLLTPAALAVTGQVIPVNAGFTFT